METEKKITFIKIFFGNAQATTLTDRGKRKEKCAPSDVL